MWFLGAGASAAAGIPTAWDMIWEFKRWMYCTAQRVPISACEDLGDPVLRDRLQRHFDGTGGGHPALGADDEYAVYFERMYGAEADRRRYLEQRIADSTPSYGHHALAALLKLGEGAGRLDHQLRPGCGGRGNASPRRDGTSGRD